LDFLWKTNSTGILLHYILIERGIFNKKVTFVMPAEGMIVYCIH